MVKEKEVREAIQIAMWILCAFQMPMKILSRLLSPQQARVLGADRESRALEGGGCCRAMKAAMLAVNPVVLVRSSGPVIVVVDGG